MLFKKFTNSRVKNDKAVLYKIILFSIIGVLLIIGFDWLIYIDFIQQWNLENLSSLFAALSFVLSIVTIYLLYANYQQQRRELSKLIQQNKESNELQIILNEKRNIDQTINNIVRKGIDINDFSMRSFDLLYKFENKVSFESMEYYDNASIIDKLDHHTIRNSIYHISSQIFTLTSIVSNNEKISLISSAFSPDFHMFLKQVHSVSLPAEIPKNVPNQKLLKRVFDFFISIKSLSIPIYKILS